MMKTYLYLTEELNQEIKETAKAQKKTKAEVMRQALKKGIEEVKEEAGGGAEILLKLAELAKKRHVKGPKDASTNLDYYLWGLPKKKS